MYDNVGLCQGEFFCLKTYNSVRVAGPESRAPYFGVHLDP